MRLCCLERAMGAGASRPASTRWLGLVRAMQMARAARVDDAVAGRVFVLPYGKSVLSLAETYASGCAGLGMLQLKLLLKNT
ncbi:hypothetical protein GUJ93_ZPchr0006g42171 [Zizania palustris]|uniref:Uncharacterized protein n=1 Tax=Zizania palustris TaxID=103762 RepID=A0A8J5SL59_ZIZPA|nr:hypothetical protein GUJ93_ZPchr0006g42171 [Zizania palustris]